MTYSYTVKKQKRRTKGVYVVGLDRVEFRVPLRMSDLELRAFVRESEPWIVQKLTEYRARLRGFEDVAEGKAILLDGAKYTIAPAPKTRLDEGARVLYALDDRAVQRFLRARAKRVLGEELAACARSMGASLDALKISSARTKWGYCTSRRTVGLNYRLVCVPPALRRYVIVHELCHLTCLNHSPVFWQAVAQYCPNYKSDRAALRDRYGFLLLD